MHQQQYAEGKGLLGKLCPGERKLAGKIFYLDNVKKRPTALLLEAISLLGGRIESFLHKDVNFVVTGSQEGLKEEKCIDPKGRVKGTNVEVQQPIKRQESVLSSEKRQPQPGTPRPVACGSRGKALLEKAIRNNERLQGNNVLANARSWGVKILYVDDVLLYLKQVSRESVSVKHKRQERTCSKQQGSPAVKAAALRSPYLKIEDFSKKYKPLHMQAVTFPSLCYLGRFSPFESPPPPLFEKHTEEEGVIKSEKKRVEGSIQDKSLTPLNCNPSPWRPRKKDTSYCECCHQPFTNLEEHLHSDQHRKFVLDPSNYTVVDQLVAEMVPGFNPSPSQQLEEMLIRPLTPLPIPEVCELEPLTDGETERAVQALRIQSLSFNTLTGGLPSLAPAVLSPGDQCPIPNSATPPADINPTECLFPPDIQPRASSPTMPVLDIEPPAHTSTSQQLTRCSSPDPYSLPPVLSPQVPYSSYIMETNCLYSDPPVLSPQPYFAEETVEGVACEMDTAENLSESVPAVSIPLLSSEAVTRAEQMNQDSFSVSSGIMFSSSGVKHEKSDSCRSRSLPRSPTTVQNPKKRCRSDSADRVHSKKRSRRAGVTFNECTWTEEEHKSKTPESDTMAKSDFRLAYDIKQDLTSSCLPSVQTMDILGHSHTSATVSPSKLKTSNPPLQFKNGKCPSGFSSQDSRHSLSHSTSVCIDSTFIPELAMFSPSSSDSDWDCDLLSRLDTASAAPLSPAEQSCELNKELLHKPCTWIHNTSYESCLHTVLQPPTAATSRDMDPSVFSRTVVQIVEVQH
ncbi:uncharacterized protein dbf4b [Solea solea]|uniref:uncharacterized protein dbf4b n=1 Tax=Solea solea TaxID=90069 RepID=UPI002729F592|nr:uncharacterized protein dbf4b [Solea solea]